MSVPATEVLDEIVVVIDAARFHGPSDHSETLAWAQESQPELKDLLTSYGAVLLRHFPVVSGREFAELTRTVAGELCRYIEGNSPRTSIDDGIYTSTEFPGKYSITMHNELSYSRWWPRLLSFYCQTPPTEGGATLVARSDVPFRLLDEAVLDKYRETGVTYVQNLHDGGGVGRSWQETFETVDRDEVEGYLSEGGAEVTWKDDGGLRISQRRPAVRSHPETGEELWFNQADQWHPSNQDKRTRDALTLIYAPEELPVNAFHGDGSPLDEQALGMLREGYAAAATPIAWQAGDVVLLDNMLVAHGRAPYSGERRILVGMA